MHTWQIIVDSKSSEEEANRCYEISKLDYYLNHKAFPTWDDKHADMYEHLTDIWIENTQMEPKGGE